MQNAWIWIVAVVIILVGGFIWWQGTQSTAPEVNLTPTDTIEVTPPPPADTSTGTSTDTSAAAPASASITYTSSGFSPATLTVKKGTTVTWTEEGGSSMWVATGPHPAHTGYDNTSRTAHCEPGYTGATPFDQCSPGSSYSFTFDKAGTWPYHDHMNASKFGKVVVE